MRFLKAVGIGSTVALTALLTFASAADAAGAAKARGEASFTLVAKSTGQTAVDVDRDGMGPGDYVVFTDDLFDKETKVGNAGTVCTLISEHNHGEAQCVFTFRSAHGDITAQALANGILSSRPKSFDAAITGGTDSFADVRGYIHGTTDNPSEVTLAFHVDY
ncbi:hypothetical protein ACH41H_48285 [Streptomyces sp. NPDC020800]|uniref:hypothetical protein n=1 Tax=Streptomyces sp. NPDC020800 TaxID=3365092 RepID=UPI0037B2B2EB